MSLVKNKGEFTYRRIGIKEASTFTGFCHFHDSSTFMALETEVLVPSAQQCFLMGYRAISRERFVKRIHLETVDLMREVDKGCTIERQEAIQWAVDLAHVGMLMGFADITYHKKLYDDMLTAARWDGYHALVIEFGASPDLLYTGAFAPEFDFRGQRVQDPLDVPPGLLAATLLPSEKGCIAVLGWEEHSDQVCRRFTESLSAVSEKEIGNSLLRLAFEHVENTYVRPSWWTTRNSAAREALALRLRVGADPNIRRRADCLKPDGFEYVNWPVLNMIMI